MEGVTNVVYNVKLDIFEGPLDLLLHLINRNEMDMDDIQVTPITEQYMDYIRAMNELELDIASEFLVMAATLVAIKSRMLVPQYEEVEEDGAYYEVEVDPRDELVQQLLEYKSFKEAANELHELEEERSLIYTKLPDDLSEFTPDEVVYTNDFGTTIYDMVAAFQKMMRRQKFKKPTPAKITKPEITVDDRMDEIREIFRNSNGCAIFSELFTAGDKSHKVVTFLALLELMKMNEVHVEQLRNYDDFQIIWKMKEMNYESI